MQDRIYSKQSFIESSIFGQIGDDSKFEIRGVRRDFVMRFQFIGLFLFTNYSSDFITSFKSQKHSFETNIARCTGDLKYRKLQLEEEKGKL